MFQPRQLLKRPFGSSSHGPDSPAKAEAVDSQTERHPAMRGIDVSPVHGRHCICGRCQQHSKVA